MNCLASPIVVSRPDAVQLMSFWGVWHHVLILMKGAIIRQWMAFFPCQCHCHWSSADCSSSSLLLWPSHCRVSSMGHATAWGDHPFGGTTVCVSSACLHLWVSSFTCTLPHVIMWPYSHHYQSIMPGTRSPTSYLQAEFETQCSPEVHWCWGTYMHSLLWNFMLCSN